MIVQGGGKPRYVAQNRDNIIKHNIKYKITTTLVSCKPMQPCIASITNYKSCIHVWHTLYILCTVVMATRKCHGWSLKCLMVFWNTCSIEPLGLVFKSRWSFFNERGLQISFIAELGLNMSVKWFNCGCHRSQKSSFQWPSTTQKSQQPYMPWHCCLYHSVQLKITSLLI